MAKKTNDVSKIYNDLREVETNVKAKKTSFYKTLVAQNFRLLKGIANFSLPFILTGAITCGCFAAFYGGLPFVQDDIKKYKRYDVACEHSEIISMQTSFVSKYWFDEEILENEMVVYTPWTYDGNTYTREIVTFDVDDKYNDSLMQSLLSRDGEALIEVGKISSREEETSNLPKDLDDTFYIDAILHQIDKKDILSFPESELKNIIITIIEAVITLGAGSFIAYKRDFSIIATLNDVKFHIHSSYSLYHTLREEFKEKKLVLSKKGETKDED